MQAFESTLRKLGGNGGVAISLEDMTIAMSRINAQATLDDIRDFFKTVGGVTRRTDGQYTAGDDQQVQVGEILQLL